VYTGGCHCGAVRFETTADLDQVITCNCSICLKRGLLLTFVKAEHFALRAGNEAELTDYQFNNKIIHHRFCPVCGVEAFADGHPPGAEEKLIGVNVRCIDGIDLSTLKPKPFDGRSR
jgi:hypothetical protein